MKRAEAESMKKEFEKYAGDLSRAFDKSINQQKRNLEIDFNENSDIYSCFQNIYDLIKRFHEESGKELLFMKKIEYAGAELNKAGAEVDKLRIQLAICSEMLNSKQTPTDIQTLTD